MNFYSTDMDGYESAFVGLIILLYFFKEYTTNLLLLLKGGCSMDSETSCCPICERPATLRYRGHIGYQQPHTYDIFHCANCSTAFASPLKVDTVIYDLIYSKAEKLEGYSRYHRFANEVLLTKKPLEHLANVEDVYWSIQKFLSEEKKAPLKILEVGSGYGYLTYALKQAGYDVVGLDISDVAVQQANQKYGPLFLCMDIKEYAEKKPSQYDVVIFTEVIEHIQDVLGFMKAATNLLKPGGKLVVTTPNRSTFAPDVLWATEAPPVHLFWFAEASMKYLADLLDLRVSFVDFTEYNIYEVLKYNDYQRPKTVGNYQPTSHSRLDPAGEIIPNNFCFNFSNHDVPQEDPSKPFLIKYWSKLKRKISRKFLMFRDKARKRLLIRYLKKNPQRRFTMCAIFEKPPIS